MAKTYYKTLSFENWPYEYGAVRVTSSVKVRIDEKEKKAVVSVVELKTKVSVKGGKGLTASVSHTLAAGGTSVFTKSASYKEGIQYKETLSGEKKEFDRADLDANITLQYTVAHGADSFFKTKSISIPALSDDTIRPTRKVTGLAVTRDGSTFTASWKVPSAATDSSALNRFTGIEAKWRLVRDGKDATETDKGLEHNATSDTQTYSGWGKSRSKYHPDEEDANVQGVKVWVRGFHRRGSTTRKVYGEWAGPAEYSFAKPRKPEVSWDFDEATKKGTVTVKTDEGKDERERRDTSITVTVPAAGTSKKAVHSYTTKATSWTRTFDLTRFFNPGADTKAYSVTCEATARGIRGDTTAKATLKLGKPSVPTLGAATLSGTRETSKVTVPVSYSGLDCTLQLQRRHGASGSAEDVTGATDNSKGCEALYDTWGAVWPAGQVAGERVYYRVSATRDGYTALSAWQEAGCLYVAKPKERCLATVKLMVLPRASGTAADAIMYWSDASANHGCELSWSDRKDAWTSTEAPTKQEFDDATLAAAGGDAAIKKDKWLGASSIAIGGLATGKTYYARMRRYRDAESGRIYSDYTDVATFRTESASDDKCYVRSIESAAGGTALKVHLGWAEDNANTGTEVSWATSAAAWDRSTDDPETATFTKADKAPADAQYTGTYTVLLTGLTPGETYYVKARRYLEAGGETTYSEYSKAKKWTTDKPSEAAEATAANDRCYVVSAKPSADGTKASVVIGFAEDSDNTGTEVSWATSSKAWNASNVTPENFTVTGKDSKQAARSYTPKDKDEVALTGTKTVEVSRLTPGEKYWFKARRYKESGNDRTWTPYSAARTVTMPEPRTPTAEDDACCIVSVKRSSDGKKATVVVGFAEDDQNTGTEVSWSEYAKAWNASSEKPATATVTGEDSTRKADTCDGMTLTGTKTVTLYNLDPYTTYHVSARRYLEGEKTTYTEYADRKASHGLDNPAEETALDDGCYLLSVTAMPSGTDARVIVGFAEDSDNTGTEIAWSTDPNALSSSSGPQTATFEGKDATRAAKKHKYQDKDGTAHEVTLTGTTTAYLSGLKQDTAYYVWARRYLEAGGETTRTPYTGRESFRTEGASDDSCRILAAQRTSNGEAAVLTVGYTEDNPNTGTEVSWSEDPYAWGVTAGEKPSAVQVVGEDAEPPEGDWSGKLDPFAAVMGFKTITVFGLDPNATYYFAARRYLEAGGDTTYTAYSDMRKLKGETAKDDRCFVVSADMGSDSATVVVGFREDDPNTGTELSWSTDSTAWAVANGPLETLTDEGTDSPAKATKYRHTVDGKTKTETLTGTRTFAVTGLTPGEKYHFRARRYRTSSGSTTYTPYSARRAFDAEALPTAADDRCFVVSADEGASGTTCTVLIGFKEDVENTGTEVEWCDDNTKFGSSNNPPDSGSFDGKDATQKEDEYEGVKLTGTHTVTLRGLVPGTSYHMRARRYRDDGEGNVTRTRWAVAKFVTESAADDTCGIVSAKAAAGGTSCDVVVGYTEDNANTGTEIEWSDHEDAWRSNEGPESMQATWKGKSSSGKYAKKQQVSLRGLAPGKDYWVRARRYLEAGGTTTYSPWSELKPFSTPVETAADDKCGVVSATVEGDGTGAAVVVGWNENNANTGTEVMWSDDPDAWESSAQPQSMTATWADGQSASDKWRSTATVHLRGLALDTTYHVRARRYREGADGTTYSSYSRKLVSFKTPRAHGDPDVRCALVSVDPVGGDSARVVVGWAGDRTGCEVSWSPDSDAWESTDGPQRVEFDWADGASQSSKWPHTSTVYVRGLKEGETCYVRARSYYDGEDGRAWSGYTGDKRVRPVSAPSSVTLSAPEAVARGESIELYWSVAHELEQAEWHVHGSASPSKALATGKGSLCHAIIPAGRYGDASSVTLYVSAGCGGDLTDSNQVTVAIADKPSCECSCSDVLGAQRAKVRAYTDDPSCTLAVTLRSLGVTYDAPDGPRDQLAGDVIWTGVKSPAWTATTWGATPLWTKLSSGATAAATARSTALEAATYAVSEDETVDPNASYFKLSGGVHVPVTPQGGEDPSDLGWLVIPDADEEAEVLNAISAHAEAQAALAAHPSSGAVYTKLLSLPEALDLVDGGSYEFSVQAREKVAGLASETATCRFSVMWSHQAPDPSAAIELAVDMAERSVTMDLPAPSGAAEGDVYDVYRMTPTGHELALRGVAPGSTVIDPYAPFGADAHYRVATRTVDGDVAFADFPYSLPVLALRFDWPEGHVELPYNVRLSDRYEKDFEARGHADGSVGGYYNRAVSRTGTYQVDVHKADSDTISALRALGEHAGAAFCRRADGDAFQCNADLGGIDLSYASMAAGVSFPVTQVALTGQFMARVEGGE